MCQEDYIEGRMAQLPARKSKNRAKADPCTEVEKADFQSSVGDLHWVTSQTRPDHAVDTSRFQKRQTKPTYSDYIDLGKAIKAVKETSTFKLRIRPISNPVVGADMLGGAPSQVQLADPSMCPMTHVLQLRILA